MCTVEPRAEWRADLDACSPGERLAASAALLAVRLWCLPFLVLIWALGWTAIGAIRGAGVVANLCATARVGRSVARGAIHPATSGPHHLAGAGERVAAAGRV